MIELKELCVKENDRTVAESVSLKLPNNRLYGVLSPNEEDSVRFLAALAGTVPYTGTIKINGFDLCKQPKKARACFGFLPCGAPLYTPFDTVDALGFVAQSKGIPYERAMRKLHELTEGTALSSIKNRIASEMSDIERRLLGILQAAMGDGDVLILTHPTQDLGKRDTEEVLALIEYLSEQYTVFVSAQSAASLPQNCDHILLVHNGEITQDPSSETLDTLFASVETSEKKSKNRKRTPKMDGEYELISDEEDE